MLNQLSSLHAFFLDVRHRTIPLTLRKKGKWLVESVLWHLGLSPIPPVSISSLSTEKLKGLVQKSAPAILEIGCNDGEHTLWFLNAFEAPRIFCFEPEPRAISRFKRNVGCRSGVTLVPLAVSDTNGSVEFYQSSGQPPWEGFDHLEKTGWDYSGSIKKPKEHLNVLPWIKYESKIRVPTKTIDAWNEEVGLKMIDFIWMDVQGAELSVIRGMEKTLSKVRYLYTEYSDKEMYEGQPTLKQILESLPSFEVVARYPEDVLLRNRAL